MTGLASASSASAASVPLHNGGGSETVAGYRAVFTLGERWTRYRTVSTGTVTSDTYVRTVPSGAFQCRVLISTRAQLQRRPAARFSNGELRITARGRDGALRWYVGA